MTKEIEESGDDNVDSTDDSAVADNDNSVDGDAGSKENASKKEGKDGKKEKVPGGEKEGETDLEDKESEGEKTKVIPESYDLKLPKDSLLESEVSEGISKLSQELELSNDEAQKVLEMGDALVSAYHNKLLVARDAEVDGWAEQVKNDKEYGLTKFKENELLANKVVERFAKPEFKELLKDTGYGNHPELFKFVVEIGKAMADDSPPKGQGINGNERKSTQEVLYGPSK